MVVPGGPETDTRSRGIRAARTVLFATRAVRMFAYGLLAVVLVLYLVELGLTERLVGLLLTLALLGDTVISVWMTAVADRVGRRRMLVAGAVLMIGAGFVFAVSRNWLVLAAAATLGVISPSGGEVGPFLAIEQASLAETAAGQVRTRLFAWYNLTGSFALALGSLTGGIAAAFLLRAGFDAVTSYRAVVAAYAALGGVLALLFTRLSGAMERPAARRGGVDAGVYRRLLGLGPSQRLVFRLAALFALDAFAGGLIIQSIVAYWFHIKFGVSEAMLGSLLFGANLLAGVSALLAVRLAGRIGLVRTMVFTHIPSNVLLMLVPLMPTAPLAMAILLGRFSISQMDVPTRQSYTAALVAPDERSAAGGVTGVARSIGAAISPSLTGILLSHAALLSAPFLLAGGLKIVYDLLLYRSFSRVAVAEDAGPPGECLT